MASPSSAAWTGGILLCMVLSGVGVDGDDPPMRAEPVQRTAERHRRSLRQRLGLDRQHARLVIARGVEVRAARVPDGRHDMPAPPR